MGENIMENIKMIKKRDMDYLNGLMEKNIGVIGKMENNMEKENNIIQVKIVGKGVCGIMVKEKIGLIIKIKNKK